MYGNSSFSYCSYSDSYVYNKQYALNIIDEFKKISKISERIYQIC